MSVPQVKDRPASGLRAVFAGIGSLLSGRSGKSGKDKVQAKPAAEAPANAPAPAPKAEAPETTAASETAVATEAVAAQPVAEAQPEAAAPAEAVAAEPAAEPVAAAEPEVVVTEVVVTEVVVTEVKADGELPLANYDELTVASLRARLRNLSNDDLVQLKEYEQAHQNRPEVIKMFQNRLIKMTSGLPKLVQ
jgi:hypothetical protein